MATITPQSDAAGSVSGVTYTAASAGGDTVAFGGAANPLIIIRNGSASAVTVTLAGAVVCNQGATHSTAYTCPVGDTEIPVPPQALTPSGANRGNVGLTYSSATSVTVGALAI